jgi:archaellum component FlaC
MSEVRIMPAEPKSNIERKPDAIDRTLEVHSVRMNAIDQKLGAIADLVEANTQQVASLSEAITRLENIVERGFQNLDQRLDRLAGITESQANIAASLAATVATLVQKAA